MALTITESRPAIVDFGLKILFLNVTYDASYPTGGESFSETDLNAASISTDINSIVFVAAEVSDAGIVSRFDRATKKLLAFWVDTTVDGAALAQVVNTTDLSTHDLEVLVIAK